MAKGDSMALGSRNRIRAREERKRRNVEPKERDVFGKKTDNLIPDETPTVDEVKEAQE